MDTPYGTLINRKSKDKTFYPHSVALDTPKKQAADPRAHIEATVEMYFNLTLRVNRELIRDPEKLDVTLRGFEANLLQRDLLGDEVLEARRMEVVEIIRDSRVFAAARERFPKDPASAYMARDAARAGREALRSSAGPPVGEMEMLMMNIDPENPWASLAETTDDARPAKRARR